MIVDRSHQRWIFGVTAAGMASVTVYLIYATLSANGAAGGSIPGLVFAFAGTGVIVFECLLSLRKKYPASPLGRVSAWLRAHVWLGLLSFLLILCHSGFRWGEGLASLLMWLFVIITLSGVWGVALQNWLPRRMMELVTRETLYDQIPAMIAQLRVDADERVEFITADLGVEEPEEEYVRAGGVKQYFDSAQKKSAQEKVDVEVRRRKSSPQIPIEDNAREALRAHYLQELRPFLVERPGAFAFRLFGTAEKVRAYFQHLRTILPVAAHDVLRDLESVCEERRQLAVQARLHRWLHGWLYVHVPLSMAFLALTLVHAVVSLKY
jgi:hypothetical protein